MKHIHPFIVITICILFLVPYTSLHSAGIRDDYISQTGIPRQLRQIVNENRDIALPPLHPDTSFTFETLLINKYTNFSTIDDVRIAGVLEQIRENNDWQYNFNYRRIGCTKHLEDFLPREKLIEDINFLFDVLRYGYGAYHYFGGDDVFLPIRYTMIEKLNNMDKPFQVSSFLDDLLISELQNIISDNYFQIHNVTLGAVKHILYMSDEFILYKEKNDFFTEIDGVIYKVLEISCIDTGITQPDYFILPTLTNDGEFAWVFGIVTANTGYETVEITVVFENAVTKSTRSFNVNLPQIISPQLSKSPMLEINELNGITLMKNRTLIGEQQEHIDFIYSADALKDKPVLIMDLRGTGGEQAAYTREWLRSFTNYEPDDTFLFTYSMHLTTYVIRDLLSYFIPYNIANRTFEMAELNHARKMGTQQNTASSVSYKYRLEWDKPIQNDNFVIVITDNNIHISGEMFIGQLRQLENVLFVGTNTSGTHLSVGFTRSNYRHARIGRTKLPNSKIDIIFGLELNLRPDLSQFEGIGFMPDLYVPPEESLERVLRFIERYGLLENLQ